jgi:hypothetical protein
VARPAFLQDIEIKSDTVVQVNFASTSSVDTTDSKSTSGKGLVKNKLKKQVQAKKATKETSKTTAEDEDEHAKPAKLLKNEVKEEVTKKKKDSANFWDRLK